MGLRARRCNSIFWVALVACPPVWKQRNFTGGQATSATLNFYFTVVPLRAVNEISILSPFPSFFKISSGFSQDSPCRAGRYGVFLCPLSRGKLRPRARDRITPIEGIRQPYARLLMLLPTPAQRCVGAGLHVRNERIRSSSFHSFSTTPHCSRAE
jgi:hypothetical protein